MIYLAPLFVIALLHDLVYGERQSGRLQLLLSLPDGACVWRRRALLRYALLFACLAVPVVVGVVVAGTSFGSHPEWKDTTPLPVGFHWKWYFAFHQVDDESVAGQAQAYRAGLLARQDWTNRLGWLLPSVGAQAILHRVADTDLQAQLVYQDEIAAFHREIREFYYPSLFNDRPFDAENFAKRPVFVPDNAKSSVSKEMMGTFALGGLLLLLGITASAFVRVRQ